MSTLVNKGESIVEVTTSTTGKDWTELQNKAFKKLAKEVSLPGFRKGKAPEKLIKDKVSDAQIIQEAIDLALPVLFSEIVTEHNLRPFTQPEVRINKVTKEELETTFVITLYPEVKLGEYKGINVPLVVEDVTEEEITKEINATLESNAEWILKEEAAQMGDTVVLDFKGYIDGKEFDGGSADNYSLVLGSNQFIPGFEDQLVGATPESKVTVNVTFPTQYVKELAGKDAKFVCMVHEIKAKAIPELNDEFVATLGKENITTVDALKEDVRKNLELRHKTAGEQQQFTELLNKIVENSEITINDKVLEKEALMRKEQIIQQISQNGISYEQYLEITGMTDATLIDTLKVEASKSLKELLCLYEVANAEKITVAETDLDAFYTGVAAQYGMTKEDVKKYYGAQEGQLRESLLQNKIEKFLIDNNLKISE